MSRPLPIHDPHHPLESALRASWEDYIRRRPRFDVLSGPEIQTIPASQEWDPNTLTGGVIPYPHGRMTPRDHLVAAEIIQWLGTPCGFAFLTGAFRRAGGEVVYDDYSKKGATT